MPIKYNSQSLAINKTQVRGNPTDPKTAPWTSDYYIEDKKVPPVDQRDYYKTRSQVVDAKGKYPKINDGESILGKSNPNANVGVGNFKLDKKGKAQPILPGFYSSDATPGSAGSFDQNIQYPEVSNEATQRWSYFDPEFKIDPSMEAPSGRHYVFICRPDLNIFDDDEYKPGTNPTVKSTVLRSGTSTHKPGDSTYLGFLGTDQQQYFRYLQLSHPEILASLTGYFTGGFADNNENIYQGAEKKGPMKGTQVSGFGNAVLTDNTHAKIRTISGIKRLRLPYHGFIPFLTGRVESLGVPPYNIKTNSWVQPYTHYSMPYTQSSIESVTGGNLSITFREDRWLSIHKLFYAWVYYQNGVMRASLNPKDKYPRYNALDYATSIYDFIVDDTGENIIYWSKYTGCVPTGVPMEDLSYSRGQNPDSSVSIDFNYFLVEHMDPEIIMDFHMNSLSPYILNAYCKTGNQFDPDKTDTRLYPVSYEDTVSGFQNFGKGNQWINLSPDYQQFGRTLSRPVVCWVKEDGKRKLKLRWLERDTREDEDDDTPTR